MQNNNIPDNRFELQEKNKNAIQKQELITSPLSLLQEQEVIIQKGLMGFMEAGAALGRIKKNKLYQGSYST